MPPRFHTAFLITAAVLGLLVSAGSGSAIYGIRHVEDRVSKLHSGKRCQGKNCLRSVDSQCLNEACTFLILGSDSRAGLSKEEQAAFGSETTVTGQRTDTIILVQIDPRRNRTVVLSLPRDLRVEIPGHGLGKINSSFQWGPDVMVQTVSRLTGLRINHYVQVNLAGFERVVDTLGGVPICVDRPLFDELSGLRLPRAGCYTLYGRQALAFVRARHIQGDAIPDLSRISRQQQFMRAVIEKTLSAGSIFKLPSLINAVQKNIVIDDKLNLYKLQDLTRKLAQLGQGRVYFRVVPTMPLLLNGVAFLQVQQPQARALFHRLRAGAPLGVIGRAAAGTVLSPANVRVKVSYAEGERPAHIVSSYLRRAGFVVLAIAPAPKRFTKTAVLWSPDRQDERRVVAAYLPALPLQEIGRHPAGVDVTVVIGRDFRGVEG